MEHVTEWLSAYIDGEMTPERRSGVEAHAERCSSCREALSEARSVSRLVAGLPQKPLPAGFMTRLRRRQAQETRRSPLLLPQSGLAMALASVAAVFVVYRGAQERLPAAVRLEEAMPAKSLPAAVPKAARAKKGLEAARAPGAPVEAEAKAEPPPSRYSNEFLHKAVVAEQQRMGIVGVAAPNPRERAFKNYVRAQRMEGNDFVKLTGAPPPPSIQGAGPAMLAAAEGAVSARRGASSSGLGGGAGASGGALDYVSRAQFTPDGSGAVVRSQADLQDLWRRLGLAAQAPTVDFSRQMAVFVLAGQGRAAFDIVDAVQAQGRVVVSYKEGTGSPYPFRVVDLSDLPVEFRKLP